mgnify:CR=1 FL=1
MKEFKTPETIFDITDDAYEMANDAIDFCRWQRGTARAKIEVGKGDDLLYTPNEVYKMVNTAMDSLKDIRELLRFSVNFEVMENENV